MRGGQGRPDQRPRVAATYDKICGAIFVQEMAPMIDTYPTGLSLHVDLFETDADRVLTVQSRQTQLLLLGGFCVSTFL